MNAILRSFVSICLLRMGPQDLPAAPALLVIAIFLYMATGMIVAAQHMSMAGAIGLATLDTALFGFMLFLLLWIQQKLERFQQTFTALLGTGALLELVAVPLLMWQQHGIDISAETLTTGAIIASLLLWVWLFWSLLVIGHIIRHAIDTILPIGVLLGVLYMFVTFSVTRSLFFSAPV
jgi:hypothetical protein